MTDKGVKGNRRTLILNLLLLVIGWMFYSFVISTLPEVAQAVIISMLIFFFVIPMIVSAFLKPENERDEQFNNFLLAWNSFFLGGFLVLFACRAYLSKTVYYQLEFPTNEAYYSVLAIIFAISPYAYEFIMKKYRNHDTDKYAKS